MREIRTCVLLFAFGILSFCRVVTAQNPLSQLTTMMV
jgi:hypothetical protein